MVMKMCVTEIKNLQYLQSALKKNKTYFLLALGFRKGILVSKLYLNVEVSLNVYIKFWFSEFKYACFIGKHEYS